MPDPSGTGGGQWIPPVAFHFLVQVVDRSGKSSVSFQEVSGISSEIVTESVEEGGENRRVYELPKGVRYGKLELKRAVAAWDEPFVAWCRAILENDFSKPVVPKLVQVFLLDETGSPLRGWAFFEAYPVKWEIEGFGAMKNEVAIEKVTLGFATMSRIQGG